MEKFMLIKWNILMMTFQILLHMCKKKNKIKNLEKLRDKL
jgi:hypothetical protein